MIRRTSATRYSSVANPELPGEQGTHLSQHIHPVTSRLNQPAISHDDESHAGPFLLAKHSSAPRVSARRASSRHEFRVVDAVKSRSLKLLRRISTMRLPQVGNAAFLTREAGARLRGPGPPPAWVRGRSQLHGLSRIPVSELCARGRSSAGRVCCATPGALSSADRVRFFTRDHHRRPGRQSASRGGSRAARSEQDELLSRQADRRATFIEPRAR